MLLLLLYSDSRFPRSVFRYAGKLIAVQKSTARSTGMEYTLEDAFETLKDKETRRVKDIEDLTNVISNNEVYTLKTSSSSEEVKIKQNRLRQKLLQEIEQVEVPEDYPVPRTSDLRVEVITEMEDEIRDMEKLLGSLEHKLSGIQEDIG